MIRLFILFTSIFTFCSSYAATEVKTVPNETYGTTIGDFSTSGSYIIRKYTSSFESSLTVFKTEDGSVVFNKIFSGSYGFEKVDVIDSKGILFVSLLEYHFNEVASSHLFDLKSGKEIIKHRYLGKQIVKTYFDEVNNKVIALSLIENSYEFDNVSGAEKKISSEATSDNRTYFIPSNNGLYGIRAQYGESEVEFYSLSNGTLNLRLPSQIFNNFDHIFAREVEGKYLVVFNEPNLLVTIIDLKNKTTVYEREGGWVSATIPMLNSKQMAIHEDGFKRLKLFSFENGNTMETSINETFAALGMSDTHVTYLSFSSNISTLSITDLQPVGVSQKFDCGLIAKLANNGGALMCSDTTELKWWQL